MEQVKKVEKETKGSQPLTAEQPQKRMKYIIYPVFVLLFCGCMWLIFAPAGGDADSILGSSGLNTRVPSPKDQGIIGDKQKAYDAEQMELKRKQKMKSLSEFALLTGSTTSQSEQVSLELEQEDTQVAAGNAFHKKKSVPAIASSANAYRDMNRTLGSFYEKPKLDPEKEGMKQELEDLKARLEEKEAGKSSMDEQLALMEKSYQMAAKYMPQTSAGNNSAEGIVKSFADKNTPNDKKVGSPSGDKLPVLPVSGVLAQTVSALPQKIRFEELTASRNTFNTAVGSVSLSAKNTIAACVAADQCLTSGQRVCLRLLEAMQVGAVQVPKNTLIRGVCKLQEERLEIKIASVEYQGRLFPVELVVYDSDGQLGIYIPNSMELHAAKEIAANMGTRVGSSEMSFSQSPNVGTQLAADLGKGVLTGVSAYFSKKVKRVNVNLKAGYTLLISTMEN